MSTKVRQVTGSVDRVRGNRVPPVKVDHGDDERVVGFDIRESSLTQFSTRRKSHDYVWTAYVAGPA